MARTDKDSWDLASSVGATATMVAAARAVGSREDNPLFDDPYAAPLVRAVGLDFFTRLVDGEVDLPDGGNPGGPAFLATEYHPDAAASIGERLQEMKEQWGDAPVDMDITKLFYDGERNGVVEYLTEHGWGVSARRRPEVFAGYGRVFPDSDTLVPLRDSLAVIATRK